MTSGELALLLEADDGLPRVVLTLSIRTRNPGNLRRSNSRIEALARAGEDRKQRKTAFVLTLAAIHKSGYTRADLIPARVTLVRVGAGHLDPHDGLPSAMKRVVDGIADALGVNDGGRFVRWRYGQRKAPPKTYAVEVRIERE